MSQIEVIVKLRNFNYCYLLKNHLLKSHLDQTNDVTEKLNRTSLSSKRGTVGQRIYHTGTVHYKEYKGTRTKYPAINHIKRAMRITQVIQYDRPLPASNQMYNVGDKEYLMKFAITFTFFKNAFICIETIIGKLHMERSSFSSKVTILWVMKL